MWMEKLRRGVLQVSTDSGLRYVEPSLTERLQLIWTFRNFNFLSEEVMTAHERQLMAHLCAAARLKQVRGIEQPPACVIGTVERLAPPAAKPPSRVSAIRSAHQSA
jgi:hypothetical protein